MMFHLCFAEHLGAFALLLTELQVLLDVLFATQSPHPCEEAGT